MIELIKRRIGLEDRSEVVRVIADYYIRTYLGISNYEEELGKIELTKRRSYSPSGGESE